MKSLSAHKVKLQLAILMLVTFTAGFAFGATGQRGIAQDGFAIGDVEQAFGPLWEAFDVIESRYVDAGAVTVPELVDGAIAGMVNSLGDKYSGYMDVESFEAFNTSLSGSVEGIGVVIDTEAETGNFYVVSLIPGAAAIEAGVQPGDIFWEVDGLPVTGINQADLATLVRGPAGSQVRIVFKRGEELIEFIITRVKFDLATVNSGLVDENIAYIRLYEFSAVARQQVDKALRELDVNSRKGLIFDLRGNPGGLLPVAVDMGSLFIKKGVLLYETFSDGTEQIFEANGNYGNITVPIVILVDETSASTSELIAGAVKDYGAATLIGETTFGKGTVQTIHELSNNAGLRITIARWLTPNRHWIHDQGVMPDIVVEWNPKTPADFEGPDPQLQAAIDFLNR